MNSDENNKPPGSSGQSDDKDASSGWISALESAIETLGTDTEDANPKLIEELEAALEAIKTSRS